MLIFVRKPIYNLISHCLHIEINIINIFENIIPNKAVRNRCTREFLEREPLKSYLSVKTDL